MTFGSVYEILNPLTEIRKQKFWDWFDGNDLKAWWSKNNSVGVNTFQMADVVDGGFEILTDGNNNALANISHGSIHHYSETAAVIIGIIENVDTLMATRFGWTKGSQDPTDDWAVYSNNLSATFIRLRTAREAPPTEVNTDLNSDQIKHLAKVEMRASDIVMFLEGVLKATATTDLPTAPQNPHFDVRANEAVAKTGRIQYCEAYNT